VCRGAGVEALVVASDVADGVRSRRPRGAGAALPAETAIATDPGLFERLRALRKRLADAEGVPAYIVFSDAVLRQMAARAPASRAEMLEISGVGPVKFERYGEAFLAALREG
jgi:ATP-dependent DNA helicase RecQ